MPSASAPHTLDTAALGDHLDRLSRAAMSMTGSRADADDLVQETYVRVLAKPREVRGEPIGYLLRVLRNTFIDQCRAQARHRTLPVEPASLEHVCADRRGDPELGTLAREVHRAIVALPPAYRDAVVAVDVVGLPYADAATACGVPKGTIMSRLHRGRAAVVRSLDGPLAA